MSSPERQPTAWSQCVAVQEQCVPSVCGIACVPVQLWAFGSAHRHLAAHFQLMSVVEERVKHFPLRADRKPGWFLVLQL